MAAPYAFDRYLRYDELTAWLQALAAEHPDLVTVEAYGRSHEGRDLWLVTVTDAATGTHDTKPAHWVDASIHAVELTATVAACRLLQHLVDGHAGGDATVTRALATRTFYVVPRVNPDGAEWALSDPPRFRRSSTRPWPYPDAHRWPGAHVEDVDGDGRVLQMRLPDPDGAWMPHPEDARLLVPVPPSGAPDGVPRYRLLDEGTIVDFDGFTVPTPAPPESLDLNRNFPAGWATTVRGSGDHPMSEPEIDALVRAIVARPNVCGYNAFHTSGGVLLRPSSMAADTTMLPADLWAWAELGKIGTALTGYPVHSVFEDFTWDKSDTMSGAADDWAYEHLGVISWTTEFWDAVHAATGAKQSSDFWYLGPTDDQALAVLRWVDEHDPGGYAAWYPFDHPQLGPVELGGWSYLGTWTNPPATRLAAEVAPHAEFAVAQALASPCLEVGHVRGVDLGGGTWRVELGVTNTGWLPTDVTARARKQHLVRPIVAELTGGSGGGRPRPPAGRPARRAGRRPVQLLARRHARSPARHVGRQRSRRDGDRADRPPRPGRGRPRRPHAGMSGADGAVGIFHEATGQGPAVLLTHGFAASSQMFAATVSDLSADHTAIVWDQLGHARSDSPEDPAAYSVAESLEAMLGVLDAVGVDRGPARPLARRLPVAWSWRWPIPSGCAGSCSSTPARAIATTAAASSGTRWPRGMPECSTTTGSPGSAGCRAAPRSTPVCTAAPPGWPARRAACSRRPTAT